ncbi:hypothetical protein SAMN05421882_102923 [Nitrosomonas communis]|uniref:Uncharacterized protein n=2 Tax=Nitrosomonas communis TaxID=44574 RepID=A0A1H2WIC6_9PROT|nr:hypothetical protein SAMN05421882_102923 [Nitrosomonas communis]
MLRQQWGPEQISGRLKREGWASICHETISQYILKVERPAGDQLYLNLRHHAKKYHKRYGGITSNRKHIHNRVDIDRYPKIAIRGEWLNYWEADSMIGREHKANLISYEKGHLIE